MFLKFNVTGTFKEIAYVTITYSCTILLGISRSYLTFLFYQLDQPDSFIRTDNEQKSWIAACIGFLSPIGSLGGGVLMDVYGRKKTIQIIFVPFAASWILISFAQNVPTLYIANLIQSIGLGMCNIVVTYISEISTVEHRGALLGLTEIPYNFGISGCYLLMYYFKWNIVAIVFSMLCTLCLLLSFTLPESPAWLYFKGHKDKAMITLTKLRCTKPENLEAERIDMENDFSSKTKTHTCMETLKNIRNAWKPFLIVTIMMVIQQNTGYNLFTSYFIMIVDDLRPSYASADIAIWFSVVSAVCSFLTPVIMYKYGRKSTYSISALGMGVSVGVLAFYQELYADQIVKPFAWIVPLTLCMYTFSSNLGVLPIGYTIVGEIFPSESRGILNGIYGVLCYQYGSWLLKFYPAFLSHYGATWSMWVFCVFSMLSMLFGVFVLPETKGKTLKQVQEQYFKKASSSKN